MAHVPSRTSRYFDDGTGGERSLAHARAILRQRPTEYDPDLFDTIIDMIASGESLNEICTDRDAPLPGTFYRWLKEDTRLEERYYDALASHAEVIFDEATSAAYSNDAIQGGLRHRALVTRFERMMPDKYGPRATLRNTKEVEDEAGGIDWAGDVRRRLGAMADRMQTSADASEDKGSGTTGEG